GLSVPGAQGGASTGGGARGGGAERSTKRLGPALRLGRAGRRAASGWPGSELAGWEPQHTPGSWTNPRTRMRCAMPEG
ncbi:hypothetical protein U0070_009662, partial [Myodes glareolus]